MMLWVRRDESSTSSNNSSPLLMLVLLMKTRWTNNRQEGSVECVADASYLRVSVSCVWHGLPRYIDSVHCPASNMHDTDSLRALVALERLIISGRCFAKRPSPADLPQSDLRVGSTSGRIEMRNTREAERWTVDTMSSHCSAEPLDSATEHHHPLTDRQTDRQSSTHNGPHTSYERRNDEHAARRDGDRIYNHWQYTV